MSKKKKCKHDFYEYPRCGCKVCRNCDGYIFKELTDCSCRAWYKEQELR